MTLHETLGLPGPDDAPYWRMVEQIAHSLNTDGCSGPALQVYVEACWEHDIHYRTHKTVHGKPLTKEQADRILWERVREFSWLGVVSPMAWWRYYAVKHFGQKSWDDGQS